MMSLSRNSNCIGRFVTEAALYAQPLRINYFPIPSLGNAAYRHRGTAFRQTNSKV